MLGTLQKKLCISFLHFLFTFFPVRPTKATGNPFSPCPGTPRGVRKAGVGGLPSPVGPSHLHHAQRQHRDHSLDLNALHTPGSCFLVCILHLRLCKQNKEREELVLCHKAGSDKAGSA